MSGSPASTATTVFVGGGQPMRVGTSSTDTVGFFDAAVTVQPTSTLEAVAISTAAVSISATQWGFTTSTQADGVVRLVNRLRADLVSLGLIKGS